MRVNHRWILTIIGPRSTPKLSEEWILNRIALLIIGWVKESLILSATRSSFKMLRDLDQCPLGSNLKFKSLTLVDHPSEFNSRNGISQTLETILSMKWWFNNLRDPEKFGWLAKDTLTSLTSTRLLSHTLRDKLRLLRKSLSTFRRLSESFQFSRRRYPDNKILNLLRDLLSLSLTWSKFSTYWVDRLSSTKPWCSLLG